MIRHTQSKRLIIWILGLLATITPFAIDLYLPAFSQIAKAFAIEPGKVALSVSSYFIGMAIGQLLYGPLLDRFGRKKPLYAGLLVFIGASIGCMQSGNIETMAILRFLQALGGSVAWVAAVAMVRDFFPVEESAKVFSLLILIIGVSPLLAPTIGGFITTHFGWEAIFILLSAIATIAVLIVYVYLPEGHQPDASISLKAKPMVDTFLSILREPQFYTYALAGAFSFSTLFIYVAGSPVIFMEIYDVSPQAYGGIFALLSVGFIGGSQFNIYLVKKIASSKIFSATLIIQVIASILFLIGGLSDLLGLYGTIVMFFICLTCIGIINPNANALALAPFSKNGGSASALMGFLQIGVAGLASTGIGALKSPGITTIAMLLVVTSSIALIILFIGTKKVGNPSVNADASGHVAH